VSRPRRPTADELALWRRVMGGTAPLREPNTPPVRPADPSVPPAARPERRGSSEPARRPSAALDPHRPVGLDRRTWLRLKRGQITIEQTLDLHGRTQADAHDALGRFLTAAQAAGCRCVLVVTGKGLVGGGTLRHMVPRWLNEGAIRERIVAFSPAQARHGGAGALYVLLRRHRDR
jgi:DNA-nicking Smr family endonuclease